MSRSIARFLFHPLAAMMVVVGMLMLMVIELAPLPKPALVPNLGIEDGVHIDVQDISLYEYAPLWRAEIARRFPSAIGILCHGGDPIDGQWITSAHAYGHSVLITSLVKREMELHPNHVIVLLSCNTGHLRLGIPGVYYAKSSVWCVPDRAMTGDDFEDNLKLGLVPDTQPAYPTPFLPSIIPQLPTFLQKTIVVKVMPKPTRWEKEPETVGNIFEFIHD